MSGPGGLIGTAGPGALSGLIGPRALTGPAGPGALATPAWPGVLTGPGALAGPAWPGVLTGPGALSGLLGPGALIGPAGPGALTGPGALSGLTVVCVLLAAALLWLPGPGGGARLRRLRPQPRSWPRRRAWGAGAVAAVAIVGLLAVGPGGAVGAAVVALVARRRLVRGRARRAAAAGAGQLADALRRITDELRAGSHPAAALAGCAADGPLAAELLGPAAAAARLGDDVPAALARAGVDARVATAWALAERHGAPLADLLADAHDALRWRLRFDAGVHAQLAGPRATATVLTALPVLGIGLGQLMGADPLAVLRNGVLGQVLLVVGVGLAAAGSAWTEAILARSVPR